MSDRRRSTKEVRASEQQSRTILESISDSFFTLDQDWRFIYANPATERVLGRAPGDLIGRVLWEEYPGTVGSEIEQMYRRVIADQVPGSVTAYYPDHDRWYELRAYPATNGISVYFRDVSAAKLAEGALRASEERRRLALDSAELGAWRLDPATQELTADDRFWLIFTGTTEPLPYEGAFARIHSADQQQVREGIVAALQLENPAPYAEDYRVIHPDGTVRWVFAKGRANFDCDGPGRKLVSFDGTVADITERKQAAEGLRDTDRRLRMALTAARMVAWEYDPKTDNIVATDNLNEVYGLLPGSTLKTANEGFALVHPDDIDRHREAVRNAVDNGRDYVSKFRLIRPVDGRVIWLEERGNVMTENSGKATRLSGVVTDITELHQAEERLNTTEEQFRALADNMLQFSWTTDATGWINWYNQRWYDFTGTTLEEMQGWGWKAVHHPDHVDRVVEHFQRCIENGEPWEDTFPLRSKDGSYRWFLSRAQPIRDSEGRLVRWFGTNTDVTEQRETAERLREVVAALSKADRRKDEFLSILAHELRNPMAPIGNGLQLLNHCEDIAAARKPLAIIERQFALMVRLVDDLMDVSRITLGKVELRRERLDLASVVQQAVETSRVLIEASRNELIVSQTQPVFVVGDVTRLAQILSNLLNNAAKYSTPGGRITLTVEQQGDTAVMGVHDTGIGISPEALPHVFELFTQAERSLEKSRGGLGIGLSLVKGFAEMHGGTVRAASEGLGQGSTFEVHLPAAPSIVTELQTHTATSPATETPISRRIVIADDNVDAAETLRLLLEIIGHEVCTAHDGVQAVECAEAFKPDLIFLDIGMPRLNGLEACRQIRQTSSGAHIVIVALTGWSQEADKARSQEAGFDAHLVKPVLLPGLEQLLASFPRRVG